MRLKERVQRLPAWLMAEALRCPWEWHPGLAGTEPPCRRGEDCTACLERMLDEAEPGPWPDDAESDVVEEAMDMLRPGTRAKAEAIRKGMKHDDTQTV